MLAYNSNDTNKDGGFLGFDSSPPHPGGLYAWQKWGGAFDGLHAMLGFHSVFQFPHGNPAEFANLILGGDSQRKLAAQPIVSAWMSASDITQITGIQPAALGPIGPEGVSDLADYYWGKGDVGPTIPAGQTTGYWYLSERAGLLSIH
jgi:hypothetical protein